MDGDMEEILAELVKLNEKFRQELCDIVLEHMRQTCWLYSKWKSDLEMAELLKWGCE